MKFLLQQQSQSSIKETKSNSNPPTSLNKSKTTESTGKKGLSTTITEVAASGLFSFKTKVNFFRLYPFEQFFFFSRRIQ